MEESEEQSGSQFAELGLADRLVNTVTKLGYSEPTPIQAQAIPVLLSGVDMLGQAATGTGKTAAFALPIIHRLLSSKRDGKGPYAMVLAPTRELAIQVGKSFEEYSKGTPLRVLTVYGGSPSMPQRQSLQRGVDIIVGTPGRTLDHINRRNLRLQRIEVVVLDEADEMLDMGFQDDLESILSATPDDRQTVLFSATLPSRIMGVAKKHLTDPQKVLIKKGPLSEDQTPAITQIAYVVGRNHKVAALGRILDMECPQSALVFCRTRGEVDKLTESLSTRGYSPLALHGGIGQETRERIVTRFRAGHADLLVATDVAARGLDINILTHVIHFSIPGNGEIYVHRTGRVGRAGREGTAIIMVEPKEQRFIRSLERASKAPIDVRELPTVEQLKENRADRLRKQIVDAMALPEDVQIQRIVDSLAEEFDAKDVALAAVKLVRKGMRGQDEDYKNIPKASRKPNFREGGGSGGMGRGGSKRHDNTGMVTVYISVGHQENVSPGDLVGAITNEAGIEGSSIGAIDIFKTHCLVDIRQECVEDVIHKLRYATIKGVKPKVRRDKKAGRPPAKSRTFKGKPKWKGKPRGRN